MLEINDLTIEVNHKKIIENLKLILNKNDVLAIIGEEGNGKSTLLKVVKGICEYANTFGNINTKGNKIGYLEQMINNQDLEKSVFDYLFINQEDYFDKINLLYKYLKELKINKIILEQKRIKNLSGGEKVKLQLLKILLESPDILLLDEPTNDLDIETLKWLESYINNEVRPIMIVSHDEILLSNTANCILHLELVRKKMECRYTYLKTNYEDYVSQRIRNIVHTTNIAKKEKAEYKKQQDKLSQIRNKVEYQLNTITRADPHGAKMLKRKMKSIKSQEKRMDKEELTEIPDVEEAINFFFEEVKVSNQKEIINLNIDNFKIGNRVLTKKINLSIKGNDHIVIIGNNGCGKTTLLNYIYNLLETRKDIKVGYMPQFYDDILNKYKNPISFLCDENDVIECAKVRSYMGNINFTKEEMVSRISNLSGGTKAKLLLLKLMYEKCNVLILDEPTRNVSPLSNPMIRRALKEYQGTIISVSHDRKYIKEVCNKVYEMNNDKIEIKNMDL